MTDPILLACPQCTALNRVPGERLADAPTCGKCRSAMFLGKPVAVDDASFERVVLKSGIPVVVDFWAAWCGPCRAFAPVFEEATRRLEPALRFAKLDTEAAQATASRFGIRSIPTVALFGGGRELARQSGAMPLDRFMAWLGETLR
ncbi:MAG TPA: thioredoxin TrxC [Xanthomonadales bacterium]|nr:thioredoxin TrxC [Xanthomonadales bacterium]